MWWNRHKASYSPSGDLLAKHTYTNGDEVVSAAIGTNIFSHAYDSIGNQVLFSDNLTTNTFSHNQVNQMVGRVVLNAPSTAFAYTPDGGLSSDGDWDYAYDAEDQLVSVTSASLTNGAVRVFNSYDYRHRRISKTVQRLSVTTAPPPSPPIETYEWNTVEYRTFAYDDWNLIHETVAAIDGGTTNISEVQYFWGLDLSDTLQGAGGVGGLLAVSSNGQFYFPAYDNNGNVAKYIDESGNVVAAYEYDDFGRLLSSFGSMADVFHHRFSTKYFESETGLYYYGYRFYSPALMRWQNRDPIGEEGGLNLYGFCGNNAMWRFDKDGRAYFAVRKLKNTPGIIKWSTFFMCPFAKIAVDVAADYFNVEILHEQLFFEDGGNINSIGWGKDEKGEATYTRNESMEGYSQRDGGYDDCVMRIAVDKVKPDHYQLTWVGSKTKCNCQDYAAALRAKYRELENDPEVKCKCRKGK